ncbi:MAG: NAD(+) diphosphatase [Lachnospiraceae bacterium]
MIQDIAPHQLKNAFIYQKEPKDSDLLFFFDGQEILMKEAECICFPIYQDLSAHSFQNFCFQFLFQLDDTSCFWVYPKEKRNWREETETLLDGYVYQPIRTLRALPPMELAYAGVTAYHLYQWYRDTVYCSRCATPLVSDKTERMLYCPACHQQVYPRINPSVIVGVLNQDKILVTRYASQNAYRKYALVAGFTEIGETVEETVAREVMEETGLQVKNIRYYKSQPWGFTGGLLLGFWAELDGSDEIHLDTEELSEGKWVTREEIEIDPATISLTREMMAVFQEGKERER